MDSNITEIIRVKVTKEYMAFRAEGKTHHTSADLIVADFLSNAIEYKIGLGESVAMKDVIYKYCAALDAKFSTLH